MAALRRPGISVTPGPCAVRGSGCCRANCSVSCDHEVNRDYSRTWQDREQDRVTGRVVTWTREHDHYRNTGIRSEPCAVCGGTGYRDVGSKTDPVVFDQTRTVDHLGRVYRSDRPTGTTSARRYARRKLRRDGAPRT